MRLLSYSLLDNTVAWLLLSYFRRCCYNYRSCCFNHCSCIKYVVAHILLLVLQASFDVRVVKGCCAVPAVVGAVGRGHRSSDPDSGLCQTGAFFVR